MSTILSTNPSTNVLVLMSILFISNTMCVCDINDILCGQYNDHYYCIIIVCQ